jgi:hypothetical protein
MGTVLLFAIPTCDRVVRLQTDRDDNARPDIGASPALFTTPKVLTDLEFSNFHSIFRDR